MVLGENLGLHAEDLVRQSRTPKDISSGRGEKGDSMDVSAILTSHGHSGPSVNNHSKSIDKTR